MSSDFQSGIPDDGGTDILTATANYQRKHGSSDESLLLLALTWMTQVNMHEGWMKMLHESDAEMERAEEAEESPRDIELTRFKLRCLFATPPQMRFIRNLMKMSKDMDLKAIYDEEVKRRDSISAL